MVPGILCQGKEEWVASVEHDVCVSWRDWT